MERLASFDKMAATVTYLMVVVFAVSCGRSPSVPSQESMEGTWTGTIVLNTVTGGECVRANFAEYVDAGIRFPLGLGPFAMTQIGNNLKTDNLPTQIGDSCQYAGTLTNGTFMLNAANCKNYTLACRDGSGLRDVRFVSSTWRGTVQGDRASANATETYEVFFAGTQASVGRLTLDSTVEIVKD